VLDALSAVHDPSSCAGAAAVINAARGFHTVSEDASWIVSRGIATSLRLHDSFDEECCGLPMWLTSGLHAAVSNCLQSRCRHGS